MLVSMSWHAAWSRHDRSFHIAARIETVATSCGTAFASTGGCVGGANDVVRIEWSMGGMGSTVTDSSERLKRSLKSNG